MTSVIVHCGSHQIGGNCIEIICGTRRLLIDAGLPLDVRTPGDRIPATLSLERNCDGLIFSHPHLDHFGLLTNMPVNWPIWCGWGTSELIKLTVGVAQCRPIVDRIHCFQPSQPFTPGADSPFTITPYLVDHSAFDSHMLLIEAEGKKILYSGDFRFGGRKGTATTALVSRVLSKIHPDIMLIEGTSMSGRGASLREIDVQSHLKNIIDETPGRVFVSCASQNIDRLVSIYKAARQSQRTLIIDLHTALILETLAAKVKSLPGPGFSNLKVMITSSLLRKFKKENRNQFIDTLINRKIAISVHTLIARYPQAVVLLRPSIHDELTKKGLMPSGNDAMVYSMWQGYTSKPEIAAMLDDFKSNNARIAYIHASGHAGVDEIQRTLHLINPSVIIPIHTDTPESFHSFCPSRCHLLIAQDGIAIDI